MAAHTARSTSSPHFYTFTQATLVSVNTNKGSVYTNMGNVHADMSNVHTNMGDVHADMGNVHTDTGNVHANMGDVHADMGRQTRTIRVSVPTMPSYILILHLLVHPQYTP